MAYNLEAILKFKDESRAGLQSAKGNLDGLKKAAVAAGAAMVASFGAKQVFNLAKMGATAERVERRFTAFADAAGGAEPILKAFQEGAGGAASKMDAMASSSKLLQMGLVTNAAEMSQTVEMATRLGNQTASVSDRIADFAALLANQSIPRLDNFGISSGRVRARIQELQAATADLSREEAFAQAVREEGARSLAILGERTDDSLTKFEKLDAKIADLGVSAGKLAAVFLGPLVDGLTTVVGLFDPLIAKIEGAQTASKDLVDCLNAFDPAGMSVARTMETIAGRINTIEQETGGWKSAIVELSADLLGTIGRLDLLHGEMERGHKLAMEMTNTYESYLRAVDLLNTSIEDERFKIQALPPVLYAAQRGVEGLDEGQRQLIQTLDNSLQSYYDNRVAAEAAAQGAAFLGQEQDILRQNFLDSGQAVEDYRTKIENAMLDQELLGGSIGATAESLGKFNESTSVFIEGVGRIASDTPEAAKQVGALAQNLKDATEGQIASALIGLLDPEKMGAGPYLQAITDIGEGFGIMDENSIALATGLTELAGYFNDLAIPTEFAAEALALVIDNSKAGYDPILGIAELVSGMVDPTGDLAKRHQTLAPAIDDTAEAADAGATSGENLAGAMVYLATQSNRAGREAQIVTDSIGDIPKETDVYIHIHVDGDEIPHYQHGGTVPGPIGMPRLAVVHGGERYLGAPSTTNNFSMTINTRAQSEPIISQYRMMQAMMGR